MNFVEQIGTAMAVQGLNVRRGAPSTIAPIVEKVVIGDVRSFVGYVTDGESAEGNTKWFKTKEGNFFWSGAVKEIETSTNSTAVSKWHTPIRKDKFVVYQSFLNPDPQTYPKTGHHPGVDYRTNGAKSVPLFFCANGEVIETGSHPQFGNYFFFYVPNVDRTFVYFHLSNSAPAKGYYESGKECGIAGTTGKSTGIHLHLECMKGRKTSLDRAKCFISKAELLAAAEDADAFIRARLA